MNAFIRWVQFVGALTVLYAGVAFSAGLLAIIGVMFWVHPTSLLATVLGFMVAMAPRIYRRAGDWSRAYLPTVARAADAIIRAGRYKTHVGGGHAHSTH